jgi:hypothetical protein
MPSEDAHVSAALANAGLARKLLDESYTSWAVVLAFYAALHWVEAYLARIPAHSTSHKTQDTALATFQDLMPIRSEYEALHTKADRARYNLGTFTASEVESLLAIELDTIRTHFGNLIGR